MLSSYRIYYSRNRRKPRSFFENPTLLTCARLKPYPLLVDESDDGDRRIAHGSGQMSDVVELLLAGGSQNTKATKTFETGVFIFWQRQLH
jgi:hypothetical protein